MGTQETIARGIIKAGGHYVLKVKKNQRNLMKDISSYFDSNATSETVDFFDTEMERNHGREEYREYYISHCVECISNQKKWDTVKAIGMVVVNKWVGDKQEATKHFYVMDTEMSVEMFARATRSHWNIECGLHWRLDVIFNEDRSRNREGHSVANLAAVRKLVFDIIKMDASFGKISFEKKLTRYRYNFTNIENLIFRLLPKLDF